MWFHITAADVRWGRGGLPLVASGVMSRGANPVPPVVRIWRTAEVRDPEGECKAEEVEVVVGKTYELQLTVIAPFFQHPLNVVHFICNHRSRHDLRKSIYLLIINY
jgi:hypothetical protein